MLFFLPVVQVIACITVGVRLHLADRSPRLEPSHYTLARLDLRRACPLNPNRCRPPLAQHSGPHIPHGRRMNGNSRNGGVATSAAELALQISRHGAVITAQPSR